MKGILFAVGSGTLYPITRSISK